jgi:hypothetical protein
MGRPRSMSPVVEEDILGIANEILGISTWKVSIWVSVACSALVGNVTTAVFLPCAVCSGLHTKRSPCVKNVLLVVLTAVWYKSWLSCLCYNYGWREKERDMRLTPEFSQSASVGRCNSFNTSLMAVLHEHRGQDLWWQFIWTPHAFNQAYGAELQSWKTLAQFLGWFATVHWELRLVHDGSPANFSLLACNQKFPGWWTEQMPGVHAHPDSYMWGHLKLFMCSSPVDDMASFQKWIVAVFRKLWHARNLG